MEVRLLRRGFVILALIAFILLSSSAMLAQRARKPAKPAEKPLQGKREPEPRPEKPELVIQNGHSDTIRVIVFSPDGNTIASGSTDKTIRLWNAGDGKLIRTIEGHFDSITSLAFHPDGTKLVSGSLDKTVKLWDANTGRLIRSFTDHDLAVDAVAFSPDGKIIASASEDKTVNLIDANSGELIHTIENG
ncbi:MAG TPA: WD40 repeat domain-containing protein, partial [Blastocatellia bacterium]